MKYTSAKVAVLVGLSSLVGSLLSLNSLPTARIRPTSEVGPTPAVANRIPMNFSPYVDGQNPNTGITVSEAHIRQRLEIIAPYASWIRSFSCGNGLEVIGSIAHEMGLQVAMGAWIGTDDAVNRQQIACLIAQANAGNVDIAVVGSEVLRRGDITVTALLNYITEVRQAIPAAIPVTTADNTQVFLDQSALVQNIDLVFANIYPFWEGVDIQHASAVFADRYNQLSLAYPGKSIYVSETGWPSCGAHGAAIGSPENAASYFNQVESWAQQRNVTLFYFEALDETWKALEEGPQGACWGIWDKNGTMKPGMAPVFQGGRRIYLPVTTR